MPKYFKYGFDLNNLYIYDEISSNLVRNNDR